jgi:hypothetical protein
LRIRSREVIMNLTRMELPAGPALGELAQSDVVSPQEVADHMVRQVPLTAAFLGGNLMFLSWAPIGMAIRRSDVVPSWLGWVIAGSAIAAWLSFLHVPGFQRFAGPIWPLTLVVLGIFVLRFRSGAI